MVRQGPGKTKKTGVLASASRATSDPHTPGAHCPLLLSPAKTWAGPASRTGQPKGQISSLRGDLPWARQLGWEEHGVSPRGWKPIKPQGTGQRVQADREGPRVRFGRMSRPAEKWTEAQTPAGTQGRVGQEKEHSAFEPAPPQP